VPDSDHVCLVVRYYVKPGNVDAVADALRRMAPFVKEREPGCLVYRVDRSSEDPNLLFLYEEYENRAAVDAHRATPHYAEHITGTIVPLLERREVAFATPLIR
jgi:quinol monooxygenase YgiN